MQRKRKSTAECINFSIRIRTELLRKIEAVAEKENRSRNNTIAMLLDRAAREAQAK